MGMRVSCIQDNLAYGLSIVSRAVAARSTLPILSNILIATDNGRLRLAATNREMGITCWIGASIEEDGELTVPSRTLTDLVGTLLREQRVDLEVDVRGNTLHLTSGPTQAHIKGLDGNDFPITPEAAENDLVIQIPAGELKETIEMVALAAANDDTRPVLTGVSVSYAEGLLTLAAADGFRLSVRSIEIENGVGDTFSLIVPAKVLRELQRIVSDDDDLVTMIISREQSQAWFHLNSIELFTQTIDGTFPDYNQIIPNEITTETVLDVPDLLRACKRADIFAREANHLVKFTIQPEDGMTGVVRVSATSAETGENEGTLIASITGDEMEIAFNVRYLMEILSVLNVNQVFLGTSRSDKPGLLKVVGDQSFTHVVMPMHLGR